MAALAELLHLTSLHITGGQPAPDADPAALYSIKGLQELRLLLGIADTTKRRSSNKHTPS